MCAAFSPLCANPVPSQGSSSESDTSRLHEDFWTHKALGKDRQTPEAQECVQAATLDPSWPVWEDLEINVNHVFVCPPSLLWGDRL